jgi:DNA-binding GntR family transcriptional regulator
MSIDTGISLITRDGEPARTAQQEAYCYIRRQILSGVFGPGHRINLAEIATRLSISRMPIRDALRQLDAEGMVVMRPNRGANVVDLTPDQAEEYYEIRAVLEGLAAGRAAVRMTPEAIEQLTLAKEQMIRAVKEQPTWIVRHRKFQELIHQISGRPNLAREIARLTDLLTPCGAAQVALCGIEHLPDHRHDDVLDALCSGNAAFAENTMRCHVLAAARFIVVSMRDHVQGPAEIAPIPGIAIS